MIYRKADLQEKKLMSDEEKNRTHAHHLRAAVHQKTEDNKNKIVAANETIAQYKDNIETTLFDNALQTRYVESWENARIEQAFLICDQNENELTDIISNYKNEIEKEIRINSEIETYIAENQKDMEEKIDYWMRKYETEMETKTIETQVLKDQREDQAKRYETMSVTYEKHKKEIEDWLDYKEKKRIKDEIFAEQTEAAIKIQAWWRGCMVRHQLGPYNPNPKRKRKKDQKGKDKKKGKKKK